MSLRKWPGRPVYWYEGEIVKISIPFTWNLPAVREELNEKMRMFEHVIVGGPGIYLMPKYFDDMPHVTIGHEEPGVLQRVNPLATRTTQGCIRKCPFCAIGTGKIGGGTFRVFDDWPDLPIIADENLFAAPMEHFERVIHRLVKWGIADFEQGLDTRLLTPDHARLIAKIKKPVVRLALDSMQYVDQWENAFEMLRSAGIAKCNISSYALVGHTTGVDEAWDRCEFIESHKIKAYPMWFHALDTLEWNKVTPEQKALGWDDAKRQGIMQYHYFHRGGRPERIAA